MDLGISGKTALVTASSAGLGLASATALAAEGANVCIASRSMDRLEAAAASIKKAAPGATVFLFTVDMRDPASVAKLCADVKASAGDPDILVNNTGGPKPGKFFELEAGDWDTGYRLMVASTVTLYRELIPAMRAKGWGRVVNIISTSARQPIVGLTLSNAFRPGLLGLAKTVADEVAPDGVLITSVLPGLTMTDRMQEIMAADTEGHIFERLRNGIPLERAAKPHELGGVVAFLCSQRSSFVTGSAVAVDGGSIRAL